MVKDLKINYVKDDTGKTTAVLIPIKDWLKISKHIKQEIAYVTLKSDLTAAFKEVESMLNGTQEKVLLSDFLEELD